MKVTKQFSAASVIAHFVSTFDVACLDSRHFQQVSRAVLDTYAVAVAGRLEPAAQIAEKYAVGLGAGKGSSIWGGEPYTQLDPEAAALCNGIAAHVLDYDDVTEPMRGHPSVALLTALLALGESTDASGKALVGAYVVGFEVLCRMSRVMAHAHYVKGWHSTSSLGTIAAAVACARLLDLDESQTCNAIGLAIAQSGGIRANFGTMAKSFQAGQCGAAAVRAVRLAQLGFTAAEGALDGAYGFMELYANGEDLEAAFSDLDSAEELELIRSGLEIKKYPMCYATHRAVDGLLALRAEHGLSLPDVEGIEVISSPGALVALIHTRPTTGLEGKFSIQYAMTAAALDGFVGLPSFSDSSVQRPEVQAFLHRVTTREEPGTALPRWSKVVVTLANGAVLEKAVRFVRGSAKLPLSDMELDSKVRDCFAWGGRNDVAAPFIRAARRLDETSVRQLLGVAR